MESMTGYRIKIVERGGQKLVDILHKANPWAGQDCTREGCLLCKTKKEECLTNSQDCKKRNLVYETECLTCRDRKFKKIEEEYAEAGKKKVDEMKRHASRYIYIGESNRSAFERGKEHVNDIGGCKTSSHMLRHLLMVHEEEEENWNEIRFGMKILKSTRSAFNRQIAESVMIQQKRKGNIIMNAKAEYNRCALPRLAAKLGEKDMEKWREEDRREAAEEATIEEKIRMRKKEKARNRMEASRRMEAGQPKKKKQRMDKEEEGQAPGTRTGGGGEVPPVGGLVQQRTTPMPPTPQAIPSRRELPTATPPKKRKVMKAEMQQQPKKIRTNADIKRYISCKRWKEEEEREKDASDSGQQHTINLPISPPQESSEAFARIGLVPTDEVSPKKLKTGESHQPGPAVEPLLRGVRGERDEIERGPEGSESGTGTGGGGEAPPVGGLIQEEVIKIEEEKIVRELETRWSTNKPGSIMQSDGMDR